MTSHIDREFKQSQHVVASHLLHLYSGIYAPSEEKPSYNLNPTLQWLSNIGMHPE